jgi:hypothetical protein
MGIEAMVALITLMWMNYVRKFLPADFGWCLEGTRVFVEVCMWGSLDVVAHLSSRWRRISAN